MEKIDDQMLVGLKAQIVANEKLLGLENDVKSLHSLVDDLSASQVDVLNYGGKHRLRSEIVRKLDSLVALEESATQAIRHRMLSKVKGDVLKTFTSDKKAKDAALDAAIKVLSGGTGSALGKDIVGAEFAKAIAGYRNDYSKQAPGSDAILEQLAKDVAAASSAPAIDITGGNVYETHPIKA